MEVRVEVAGIRNGMGRVEEKIGFGFGFGFDIFLLGLAVNA